MQFVDVTTTIQEHPAEAIAIVATVGLIGTLLYQNRQKRLYEIELAKYRAMRPPWWSYFLRRRQTTPVLKLVA